MPVSGRCPSRSRRHARCVLVLTTDGGHADAAYLIARFLRGTYESVTACVFGYCRRAGTLLALGCHEVGKRELEAAGFDRMEQVDGSTKKNRADVIRRFAPHYNGADPELDPGDREGIRILISTDVLSEGLKPSGRVDRRMNPRVEARIGAERPELADSPGTIRFWNFLPPNELNRLLTLYSRVTRKTLLISRTLGIEGRKLLTPEKTTTRRSRSSTTPTRARARRSRRCTWSIGLCSRPIRSSRRGCPRFRGRSSAEARRCGCDPGRHVARRILRRRSAWSPAVPLPQVM